MPLPGLPEFCITCTPGDLALQRGVDARDRRVRDLRCGHRRDRAADVLTARRAVADDDDLAELHGGRAKHERHVGGVTAANR